MNLNKQIDNKTEKILKKIILKHGSYYEFMDKIVIFWSKGELLYDNILDIDLEIKIKEELDFIIKNPYYYNISLESMIDLNYKIFHKKLRENKIIHKFFNHDIADTKEINVLLKDIFKNLSENGVFLDNYYYLLYNLFKIYPFENSFIIRLFTNIYLLQNEYLPFIPFLDSKSDYYDVFKYDFYKFKKKYQEIFIENLNKISELLLKV